MSKQKKPSTSKSVSQNDPVISYERGHVYNLQPADIKLNPNQPRQHFDEQAQLDLERSIAKHGILEPILFRIDEEEKPVLVAGERRLRASQQL